MNRLALWLAQGFGVGRMPYAPGTFGSLLGLLWFALLVSLPSPVFYLAGLAVGIGLSIIVGHSAEKLLGQKDPSSVVLDEIVAVPLCFASWVTILFWREGIWPAAGAFFGRTTWLLTAGVLLAFRLCDILKPWPARQIQAWPGGWGITADDVVAAGYVNLGVLIVFLGSQMVAGAAR